MDVHAVIAPAMLMPQNAPPIAPVQYLESNINNGYGANVFHPGLVTPGNLDLSKRQLVDFSQGLTPDNSSVAARAYTVGATNGAQ